MSSFDELIKNAEAEVGGAYVFGARGDKCTPDRRRAWANAKPDHPNIRDACQVLNGKSASCSGCRYNGKRIFDCRGFTWYVLKHTTGQNLEGAGATSQWKVEKNWRLKGTLDNLPNFPVILFSKSKKRAGVMEHTGFYDGNGNTIECGGRGGVGVHKNPIMKQCWSDWALPVSLEDGSGEYKPPFRTLQVLKGQRLMRGPDVLRLQQALIKHGISVGDKGADGIYGSQTHKGVNEWLAKHNQPQTGIVTEKIYNAITSTPFTPENSQNTPPNPHAPTLYKGAFENATEGEITQIMAILGDRLKNVRAEG